MIKIILILFLRIPIGTALSENFRVSGQIDAWHDGAISDPASGIKYSEEIIGVKNDRNCNYMPCMRGRYHHNGS